MLRGSRSHKSHQELVHTRTVRGSVARESKTYHILARPTQNTACANIRTPIPTFAHHTHMPTQANKTNTHALSLSISLFSAIHAFVVVVVVVIVVRSLCASLFSLSKLMMVVLGHAKLCSSLPVPRPSFLNFPGCSYFVLGEEKVSQMSTCCLRGPEYPDVDSVGLLYKEL